MGINSLILFFFGLAAGSFINVLSLRYDPGRRIFRRAVFGGRSRCPHCERTLVWFELIPLVSFIFLRGKCRTCHTRLSLQYPFVELIGGLLTAYIPLRLSQLYIFQVHGALATPIWFIALVSLFVLAGYVLLFISAVDARLKIIPDQATLLIAGLGVLSVMIFMVAHVSALPFISHYALLFGFQDVLWVNRLVAGFFGAFFYGAIFFLTRGRGMGFGDVKLAGALGLLIGWPDIALASFCSFIIGALSGILLLAQKKKTMRSAVPFGPFIVLGAFIVFFFGDTLMHFYFTLFP